MSKQKLIYGASGSGGGGNNGGGGGKVRQPKYTRDDPGLRSLSFAQMQFLLCEGEIWGPAEGKSREGLEKSVYLDDTPIRAGSQVSPQPDDLVLSYGLPAGTSSGQQTGVPGYSNISTPTGVDKVVKRLFPISQTVNGVEPGAKYRARVLLTWKGLVRYRTDGDVLGYWTNFRISYTDANAVVYKPFGDNQSVSGKFSGQFQREFEFELKGPGPWRVTVQRFSFDDDEADDERGGDTQHNGMFSFSTVVLTLDERLVYPYSSMLSLGIRADQYGSLPKVDVDLKGLIVDVPSNYTPDTRAYSGTWDGTFKRAWTDNPAWIMRDIVVNNRYGLGTYISNDEIDKWSLYEIAKYCDEMVPKNEAGDTEPRFTCNLVLQTGEQAWTALQQLASIFRGLLYYASGTVINVQDRPKDYVFTFNDTNTIEEFDASGQVSQGNFQYSGAAMRARHTVVLVSWDDPADNYQPRVEYLSDDAGLARFGYRPLDLRLMGVTSRSQALRAARWALLSEKLLTDTCTFRTNEIGSAVRPGDLIKIADYAKGGHRLGGRILAVDGNNVTIDWVPETVPSSFWTSAKLSYMCATTDGDPIMCSRRVTAVTGTTLTLEAGSNAPDVSFPFLLEGGTITALPYRVVTVEEQEGGVYAITALQYREDLYANVDTNTPLTDNEDYLYKPVKPGAPTITAAEVIWDNNQAKLNIEWLPADTNAVTNGFDLSTAYHRLQYQAGSVQDDSSILWDNVWRELDKQNDNRELIPIDQYVASDRFKVRVNAVSRIGVQSEWATADADPIQVWFPMPDISAPNVAMFRHLNQSSGSQLFSWALSDTQVPPYVSGMRLEIKPSRALTAQESAGLAPPDSDGWYFAHLGDTSDYFALAFHAAIDWQARISFGTFVPGLTGSTYKTDSVAEEEIVPPTPINFRVVIEGQSQSRVEPKRFSWELPAPADTPFITNWPKGYVDDITRYRVRYIQGTTANWDLGFSLFSDGIPGDQTWFETNLFDYGSWTIMIRAEDNTGWLSDDFASVAVGIGQPIPTNVVDKHDIGFLGFPGDLTNFEREDSQFGLFYKIPYSDPLYETPYDELFYGDSGGYNLIQIDASQKSYYEFSLELVYPKAQLQILTAASNLTYRWWIKRRDTVIRQSLDTDREDRVTAKMASDAVGNVVVLAGIPGETVVEQWHPYAPNEELLGGTYDFKLEAASADGTNRGKVTDIDILLDYPDVNVQIEDAAIAVGGTTVFFPERSFRKLKAVQLTVQDDSDLAGRPVNAIIMEKNREFVKVKTVDANGNSVAGVVDVWAVGY